MHGYTQTQVCIYLYTYKYVQLFVTFVQTYAHTLVSLLLAWFFFWWSKFRLGLHSTVHNRLTCVLLNFRSLLGSEVQSGGNRPDPPRPRMPFAIT